jgi:hypothetical protein
LTDLRQCRVIEVSAVDEPHHDRPVDQFIGGLQFLLHGGFRAMHSDEGQKNDEPVHDHSYFRSKKHLKDSLSASISVSSV